MKYDTQRNYRIFLGLLVVAIGTGLLLLPERVDAFSGQGEGTEGDPYQITDCEELQEMSDELDAHYILMNNIDCSETTTWNDGDGFEPVGLGGFLFTGSLNGQGHTISALYIDRIDETGVGLFGWTSSAYIANLNLTEVDISGDDSVGGLVGVFCAADQEQVIIENVFTSGSVFGSSRHVGGIGGFGGGSECSGGIIQDSSSSAQIASSMFAGGLLGFIVDTTVLRSYATGTVSGGEGSGSMLGGLVGLVDNSAIFQSYATGDVLGDEYVGGLVGISDDGAVTDSFSSGGDLTANNYLGGLVGGQVAGLVARSFSTRLVQTGGEYFGGLIGRNFGGGIIEDSFWDIDISAGEGCGDTTCADEVVGLSTEQMKEIANFQDAGWDILASEAGGPNDGYPYLAWQTGDGDSVWLVFEGEEAEPEPEPESEPTPQRSRSSSRTGGVTYCTEVITTFCAPRPQQLQPSTQTIIGIVNQYRELIIQAHNAGIYIPQNILAMLGLEAPLPTTVRDLEYGMEGEDVRALQELLINQGYPIAAGTTGVFLNQTQSALADYQMTNDIFPAVGYFGPLTRVQMKAAGLAGLWW